MAMSVMHGLHRNRTDNDPSYYTVHAGLTDLEEPWPEPYERQLGTVRALGAVLGDIVPVRLG